MKTFHVTTVHRVPSICRTGLDPRRATGRRKAAWVCSASKLYWAIVHVQARHGVGPESIAVCEVSVPRGWMRRHSRGIWYTTRLVPYTRLSGWRTFRMVAAQEG